MSVKIYIPSSVAFRPRIVASNVMFWLFEPIKSYPLLGAVGVIGAEIYSTLPLAKKLYHRQYSTNPELLPGCVTGTVRLVPSNTCRDCPTLAISAFAPVEIT